MPWQNRIIEPAIDIKILPMEGSGGDFFQQNEETGRLLLSDLHINLFLIHPVADGPHKSDDAESI